MGRHPKYLTPEEVPDHLRHFLNFESQAIMIASKSPKATRKMAIVRTCIDCGKKEHISVNAIRNSIRNNLYAGRCGRCNGGRTNVGRFKKATSLLLKSSEGYIMRHMPAGHTSARKDGRMLEHRYVMSQILGRDLLPREQVHHKNGIKTDNRPENLEVWAGSHGTGSRYSDWTTKQIESLIRFLEGLLASREEANHYPPPQVSSAPRINC